MAIKLCNKLMDVGTGLALYLMLVGSIALHEWGHAIAADKIGDDTPRSQGRVTLNPIAHMDLIGTVIIPLLMIFYLSGQGFYLIGWGKPVQVDPRNFRNPVKDDLIVTAAGPAMNLIIALAVAVLGGLIFAFSGGQGSEVGLSLNDLFVQAIFLNTMLIVFNLLPIPPLDGSHFLKHALKIPDEVYYQWCAYGGFILLILINIPPFRLLLGSIIQFGVLPFLMIYSFIASLFGAFG